MRKDKQVRCFATEFRASENGEQRVIEGYFSVFGSTYVIAPGVEESVDSAAFDGALEDDIRALINHETRLVLGRTTVGTLELRVDEKGLWGRIIINTEDQDAMNLYARVKRGDVSQCSFGFDILDERREVRDDGTVHYIILRVKLYEVSVVTFPAYTDTAVEARADEIKQARKRQLDAWRETQKARLRH